MASNAENLLKRIEAFPDLARLRGVMCDLYNAVKFEPLSDKHSSGRRIHHPTSTLAGGYKTRILEEARAALLPLLEELLTYALPEQRNTSQE
jgi:hypothetical protein